MQLEPNNKEARALLARYKKESAAANARDAKMFKTMFAKLAKLPDKDPNPATVESTEPASNGTDGTADMVAMSAAEQNGAALQKTSKQKGHDPALAEPMAVDA